MFIVFWVIYWIFYVAEWLCVGATIFTESLSSFIYPETNNITETISLIILMGFLIPEILKLIIQGIYMIYVSYRVSTKKRRKTDKEIDKSTSDDSSSSHDDSSSDSSNDDESEPKNGWKYTKFWKHRMTTSSILIILTFLIFSMIFLIIIFYSVYIDWKHYANNNEEFIIDIYAFFKREAFVGPIVQTNGTTLQPISPNAVTTWILHAFTVILILIAFMLFIGSLFCFFVFVIRQIRKHRPMRRRKKRRRRRKSEKKKEIETIEQDPMYTKLEQPVFVEQVNDVELVMPFCVPSILTEQLYPDFEPEKFPEKSEVDIEQMNLHQKVNKQLDRLHEELGRSEDRQSMVNPESLKEVREVKIKPNTRE